MASFTKRNGRWRARVRRSGHPPITKSFPTKALALQWSQRVENTPEGFLPEQQTEDYELEVLGDLISKYGKDITPKNPWEMCINNYETTSVSVVLCCEWESDPNFNKTSTELVPPSLFRERS